MCWAHLRLLFAVDVDAADVRMQNGSLESLLRLTAWEQQFTRRMDTEGAFSGGPAEGQSSANGGSNSISRHATDLFQQTLSSLANHAAAHGLPFLKSRDESE